MPLRDFNHAGIWRTGAGVKFGSHFRRMSKAGMEAAVGIGIAEANQSC
jgi:hypothetical protein